MPLDHQLKMSPLKYKFMEGYPQDGFSLKAKL
jgi:hypothetical protein